VWLIEVDTAVAAWTPDEVWDWSAI
jgi:hypothetical protein